MSLGIVLSTYYSSLLHHFDHLQGFSGSYLSPSTINSNSSLKSSYCDLIGDVFGITTQTQSKFSFDNNFGRMLECSLSTSYSIYCEYLYGNRGMLHFQLHQK